MKVRLAQPGHLNQPILCSISGGKEDSRSL